MILFSFVKGLDFDLKLETKNYRVLVSINVFGCNISSLNCFHKHEIFNKFYMIIHVERHLRQCNVKSVKNISRRNKNHKCTFGNSTWFLLFLVGDLHIKKIFNKTKNPNKYKLKTAVPFLPRNIKFHKSCSVTAVLLKVNSFSKNPNFA